MGLQTAVFDEKLASWGILGVEVHHLKAATFEKSWPRSAAALPKGYI